MKKFVLFAFPQLIASVLAGTYFANKIGIEKTLVLGLGSNLVFYIIILLKIFRINIRI